MRSNIKNSLKLAILAILFTNSISTAQQIGDTLKITNLKEVEVLGTLPVPERLKEVQGAFIFSAKKNEVIRLSGINANLVTNNPRQIFSRVPGVTIWENDGSGIQVSIGMRGLNPNRSWELNTRQNGYDISSDVFGYPEAYYNPPMEAVDRIQIVRGAASLQFGPQFGGMVNYITKKETKDKPFTLETQFSGGSYGMFSNYTAIGGNTKKWSYYLYNHYRKGNGWRENSDYYVRNTHAYLKYNFNDKLSVSANPAGEIVLECDAEKGEIYVRPIGTPGGLGKPVNLFISSQHATYTLLLRRSDTPADTIVIRDRTSRQAPQARVDQAASLPASRQSIHIRSLKAMLVAMASD